jgi:hypothetical protein
MNKTLLLLLCIIGVAQAGFYENVAEFCKWVGEHTGWGCDDAAARAAWRAMNVGHFMCHSREKPQSVIGGIPTISPLQHLCIIITTINRVHWHYAG